MTRRQATAGLRREVLPNGVTLLVQRRRTAPAASLATTVHAGFLDEPDELVGISHVLEHMLFKGTPTLGPGELAQRTKALGGSLNAFTSYDRTVYYASVPARHAIDLMALQADQVQHPLLDAEELRRELGVIIQEANRKLDSPGAVTGETLHELLFDTHRIRRWRIGVESMLREFSQKDVAGYHASRYVPSRTIVSLVADQDEEAALDALRAQWGGWQRPSTAIPPGPPETSVPCVAARRIGGDVVLADIALGWRAPGVLDATVPALGVAAAILSLGRGSRFARTLRETGIVNAVGASAYGVIDAGVFTVGLELDPTRIPEALRVVGGAIRDLADAPPAQAEFDRAVAMLRSRIGRRLEDYESRALSLANAELLGDVTRLDREESDVLAVTPAMVSDVVRRWLLPDGLSAVAYLPRMSDVPFDESVLREGIGTTLVLRAARDLKARPRSNACGPSLRSGRGSSTVHHLSLPSLDILTARFGETGQVSLSMYRPRTVLETPQSAGLAALAIRAMLRGTTRHTAAELAFALESLGGGLSPTLGADVLGFGTTVLSEHVRDAAALLAEVIHEPRFAADQIEIERRLLLDDARSVADDMMRFPMQLMLGVAFNDLGYGSPSLGTDASLASFTSDHVRQWHAEMLAGERTTIIAVGDVDPEELAEMLAACLPERSEGPMTARGKTQGAHRRALPASITGPSLRSGRHITPGTRIEYRARKQSALAMLFPGPNRRAPNRFAAETWSAIAAGLGGRLFESLRSKRSLAYSVVANSWQRLNAGGLLTYIATDPARLDEARDAMLEELAVFRREPPTADELSRATAMLAGQAEMSRQTTGGYAGEIASAWLLGEGLAELEDPAAPYRAVTAEQVHAVTSQSLDPEARAEGVVMAS